MDKRIADLTKVYPSGNPLLLNIHETVSGLQKGNMKECPKCGEVRQLADFKDASLIRGYGRFCKQCKSIKAHTADGNPKPPPLLSDRVCPRCHSKMVLRDGKRGKFYGCSRFPYCKGTREYA